MPEIEYKIDPRLFDYDHPVIKKLEDGKITAQEFLRDCGPGMAISSNMDPKTKVVSIRPMSEKEIEDRKKAHISREIARLNNSGGINASHIFDRKDALLKVYPELQASYDSITIDINKCKSCQKNKEAIKVTMDLFKINKGDRDISSLKGIIPDIAYRKLDGESVQITQDDVVIPAALNKKPLILKNK